jgi:hypothetical protein
MSEDYPVEKIELPEFGCTAYLRQAHIGWEYKTVYTEKWIRANNREQALEWIDQDVKSAGREHRWRLGYEQS